MIDFQFNMDNVYVIYYKNNYDTVFLSQVYIYQIKNTLDVKSHK